MWLAAEKSGTERSTYTWDNGKKWEFPTKEGWTPTWERKYHQTILTQTLLLTHISYRKWQCCGGEVPGGAQGPPVGGYQLLQ